jgi:hypothetical protein
MMKHLAAENLARRHLKGKGELIIWVYHLISIYSAFHLFSKLQGSQYTLDGPHPTR